MKKILTLLILCFLFEIVTAQPWAPLGAQWYYNAQAGGAAPGGSEYYLFQSEKDTIYQSHDCKKISRTYFQYTGNVSFLKPYYMYHSNDTVFYYNDVFQKYTALYIFNVEAGDTLVLYSPDEYLASFDSTFRLVVDSISHLIIGTDSLKMVYTTNLDDACFQYEPYIEKIGCTFLMLPQPEGIFPEWDGKMRCYNDSLISVNFGTWPCDHWVTNGVDEVSNAESNIFFDSESQEILISIKSASEYIVFNSIGQKVKQGILQSGDNRIEMKLFSEGIYFVALRNNYNRVVKSFLKTHY